MSKPETMVKRKHTPVRNFSSRKRMRTRMGLSQRVKRVERRQRQNTEVKKVVGNISIQPNTTISTVLLNGVADGPQSFERDGEKINCIKYELRGTFNRNGTSNGSVLNPVTVRATIVTMKEGSGVAPTLADLYESTTDPRSEFSHVKRKNFIVHMDRTWNICYKFSYDNGQTQFETMPYCQKVFFTKTLKNHQTIFDGNLGTAAAITRKPMWLVMWSDHATAADSPTLNARGIMSYVG